MTQGIIIIATKHSYYGRMAYNFAITVKSISPMIPVIVLHSGRGLSHLTEAQKLIFDDLIEIEGNERGCGNKLYAYNYSPFEKTLLVDSDNAWMPGRKPEDLFKELDGVKFTAITEGLVDFDKSVNDLRPDYFMWANVEEIKREYKIQKGVLYQFRSEMMYFEKSEEIEKLFTLAQSIHESPGIEVQKFGGNIPDEFALNVAACVLGIHPHKYKWQPCYWDRIHKRPLKETSLYDSYWALSTGGNQVTYNTIKLYNRIVKAACYKLGLQFLFNLQPKKSAIQERQLM